MDSSDLPETFDGVVDYVRERLARKDAAHLDASLQQIGDRLMEQDRPTAPVDGWAHRMWQEATPDERHHLTHLMIRMVGHQDYPSEQDVRG